MAEIIRIPSPGDTIDGQFVLGKEIGRGGYGLVFEARQLGVDRIVAVKMLLPRAIEHQRDVIQRFEREARLASKLKHRNAVTIYAFGVYRDGDDSRQGLPYIAMEYLEGCSLEEYLLREGPRPTAEVSEILGDVLEVLNEAHAQGIIHRDLKPANIFFHEVEGQERVVKVLDFGIAMAVSPEWSDENRKRLTETGLVTGTAEYMAPEQAQGSTKFTAAIDVYALGCLGYQLLTGRFPFSGSNAVEIAIKHIYEPVPELSAEVMETRVGAVILKALHKDPEVRYADAGSMLAALRAPVGGQSAALSAVDTGPATAAPVPGLAMADTGPDIAAADTAPGGATAVDDVEASRTVVQPMVSEIPRPRPMIWIFGGLAVGSLLVSVGVWVVVSSGKTAAPDLAPGTMEVPSVTVAVEETPAPIEEAPNGDGVVAAEPDASAAPEDLSLKVPAEEPGEGANSGTPRVGNRRRGGRGRSQPRAAGGKEGATGDRLNPTPADVPTKDRAVEKPKVAGSGGDDAEAAQDKKKSGSAEGSGEGGGKAAAPVESKGAEEKVTAKAPEERAAEAGGKEERPSEAPVKKEEEVPHGF